MTTSRGLQIFIVALAICGSLANPLKRASGKKSARQIEFTTPSSVAVETRTGYPEAGFRPKIPFELPTEPRTNAVTEPSTESVTEFDVETIATTTKQSTLEDFDEVVPDAATTTTPAPEVLDYTPADTYGPPVESPKEPEETEAEVVPAPAEDFQPPSEEDSQDFATPFNTVDTADNQFVADIPAVEQATATEVENESKTESETQEVEVTVNQVPATTYGPPSAADGMVNGMESNEPKTDVETIEQEIVEVLEPEQFDMVPEVVEDGVAVDQEGSAEGELELVGETETRVQEPADVYGPPNTSVETELESEADNELESELADVEEQIEILSRLTKLRSGRLVILPVQKKLYLGRLVAAPKKSKRQQRLNGRLLKL